MRDITALLAPALEKYSLAEIARMAEMSPAYLSHLRSGRRNAKPSTLARVRMGIARLRTKQIGGNHEAIVIYRVTLAMCATTLGLDAALIQVSDPGAKRASNKEWRDASFARWLAQYLMNTGLGMKQTYVARVAGVTKQAVSLAMQEIELKRDDPEFEAMISRLEHSILGVS